MTSTIHFHAYISTLIPYSFCFCRQANLVFQLSPFISCDIIWIRLLLVQLVLIFNCSLISLDFNWLNYTLLVNVVIFLIEKWDQNKQIKNYCFIIVLNNFLSGDEYLWLMVSGGLSKTLVLTLSGKKNT